MQNLCHIVIEGSHNLIKFFDKRNILSCKLKVFRNFHTDKTRSDNGDVFYVLGLYIIVYLFYIDNITHDKHVRFISTFNRRWNDRWSSRRQYQHIVGFIKFFSQSQVLYGYGLCCSIYLYNLVRGFCNNVILLLKLFRRHQHKILARRHHFA